MPSRWWLKYLQLFSNLCRLFWERSCWLWSCGSVRAASLINPGPLLIRPSRERNLPIRTEGHFGVLAPPACCPSATRWGCLLGVLLSFSHLCSLSAGNSKQALRCKTCKMAAHLWCTSELSQQPCHGKVRAHSQGLMFPSHTPLPDFLITSHSKE